MTSFKRDRFKSGIQTLVWAKELIGMDHEFMMTRLLDDSFLDFEKEFPVDVEEQRRRVGQELQTASFAAADSLSHALGEPHTVTFVCRRVCPCHCMLIQQAVAVH